MQQVKFIKRIFPWLLISAVFTLSGCGLFAGKDSYIRDYSVDYVNAKETKPLDIPSDLDAESAHAVMPIPGSNSEQPVDIKPNAIPAPEDTVMQAGNYSYQIASTKEGSVIESNATRDLLWIRMQTYLDSMKVAISEKNEKAGTVQSAWYIPKDQQEHGIVYRSYAKLMNKKYKQKQEIRLSFHLTESTTKQGFQTISIRSEQKPVGGTEQDSWISDKKSILLKGVIQDFLVYLVEHSGDQITQQNHGEFNPSTMTYMIKDGNGNPVLKITSSFDTAWNQVSAALKKAQVQVRQANHAAGIFYLALPGAEHMGSEAPKSPNYFQKLFGNTKEQSDKNAPVYRLVLAPVNDGVYVTLEKDVDTVAPETLSEAVLEKIRSDLH